MVNHANTNLKKAEVVTFVSDKVDFRTNKKVRIKEGH